MDFYSLLREFADSWVLLALALFFVGAVVWAFRPGARQAHDEAANVPFRNETRPAGASPKGAPAQEALK